MLRDWILIWYQKIPQIVGLWKIQIARWFTIIVITAIISKLHCVSFSQFDLAQLNVVRLRDLDALLEYYNSDDGE